MTTSDIQHYEVESHAPTWGASVADRVLACLVLHIWMGIECNEERRTGGEEVSFKMPAPRSRAPCYSYPRTHVLDKNKFKSMVRSP